MLASVASAAMIHNTATRMNPRELFGPAMAFNGATSARSNIAGPPDRCRCNPRALGRGWPGAARRYLGVNERAGRHRQGAGGGRVPHADTNGARKLLCSAPGFPPHMVASGVGKRHAIGRPDHDDEI